MNHVFGYTLLFETYLGFLDSPGAEIAEALVVWPIRWQERTLVRSDKADTTNVILAVFER
jgi:hypothetical protein